MIRFLLLAFSCLTFSGLVGQTFDPDYLDGTLYLKVDDNSSVDLDPYPSNLPALDAIIALYGVDSLYQAFRTPDPALESIYRLEFSDVVNTGQLISALAALSYIDYAEKIPLFEVIGTQYTPNDLLAAQYSLSKIQAEDAWDLSRGDSTVTVAVIDNAVLTGHEDLAPIIWTNPGEIPNNLLDDDLNGYADDAHGYDVADLDGDANPPLPVSTNSGWHHGSHCAGIVSAKSDNGLGMASIGFNLRVIPVKASLNATGGNTLERAYEGVDYAVSAGADVISMSWGSSGNSLTGNAILAMAEARGILLVAAAGNAGDSIPFYPAAHNPVLAVGSTNDQDLKSGFSNYGNYLDLMAPGTGIYSCFASGNSDYGVLSGTSMSCPMVAGLAGLALSASPGLTLQQLKSALLNGCENIDNLNPQFAGKLGAGRINAFQTLNSIVVNSQEPAPELGMAVFPNPATSEFFIRSRAPQVRGSNVDLAVFGANGQLLEARKVAGEAIDAGLRLDLKSLPKGILLIRLTGDFVPQNFRVVHQ